MVFLILSGLLLQIEPTPTVPAQAAPAVSPWLVVFAAGSCLLAGLALAGLLAAFLWQNQNASAPQPIVSGAQAMGEMPLPAQPFDPPGSRWLVIARGAGRPVMLKLNPKGVTLGRSSENQMVLMDAQVSRFHARIARQGEAWIIADLRSSNGTYVNDAQVTLQTLSLGDRIRLGENIELVFQA